MAEKEWFDEYNLLHPDPIPATSGNGILHLAEYIKLCDDLGEDCGFNSRDINYTIRQHIRQGCKGLRFTQTPWDHDDPASHDNVTAIMFLSKRFELFYHEYLTILGEFWHPRDIIFYAYFKYGWPIFPLMFIVSIAMILSCSKTYEDSNPNLIHTDGKLLASLRWSTVKMPITEWICNSILKNKFGEHYWHVIYSTYFKVEGHPNPEEAYKLTHQTIEVI